MPHTTPALFCPVTVLVKMADIRVRVHVEAAAYVRRQSAEPRSAHGLRRVAGKQARENKSLGFAKLINIFPGELQSTTTYAPKYEDYEYSSNGLRITTCYGGPIVNRTKYCW